MPPAAKKAQCDSEKAHIVLFRDKKTRTRDLVVEDWTAARRILPQILGEAEVFKGKTRASTVPSVYLHIPTK
jgi:hypothetical protein